MNTTPFPSPTLAAAPASVPASPPKIQTREQIEALVENITGLQRERDGLYREQEQEIAAVRERYRLTIAEVERYLDQETAWAESWARGNPEAFGADRALACAGATIGFRAAPPRIERASRRWNWTRIAATLAGLDWGKRYLRVPPAEVDKEAIVSDLARLSAADLRDVGLKVVQGERFFIAAHDVAEIALREAA